MYASQPTHICCQASVSEYIELGLLKLHDVTMQPSPQTAKMSQIMRDHQGIAAVVDRVKQQRRARKAEHQGPDR